MQRSEILEPKEREDNTSASLMMMWSVALTGSKPCQVLSEGAMRALAGLHSSRGNIAGTEIVSSSRLDALVYTLQGAFRVGDNGALKRQMNDANTKVWLTILKRVICLLKEKLFGA